MISDLECAEFCQQIYTSANGWDHYWAMDDVVIGHKQLDGVDVIALRGSLTAEDWERDIYAYPRYTRQLGFIHSGFWIGMENALQEVQEVLTKPSVITGHSLGGARARILAGLLVVANKVPAKLCVFGSPKAGFSKHAKVIDDSGMEHISYRNANDPVPLLPAILPMWRHTEQWKWLMKPAPSGNFPEDHKLQYYVEGLS